MPYEWQGQRLIVHLAEPLPDAIDKDTLATVFGEPESDVEVPMLSSDRRAMFFVPRSTVTLVNAGYPPHPSSTDRWINRHTLATSLMMRIRGLAENCVPFVPAVSIRA